MNIFCIFLLLLLRLFVVLLNEYGPTNVLCTCIWLEEILLSMTVFHLSTNDCQSAIPSLTDRM